MNSINDALFEGCRRKSAEKIEEIALSLEGLPECVRFEKLCREFDGRARGIKSCLDNFMPEEFESRGHAQAGEKFLSRMMEAGIQGYHTLQGITKLMEQSDMSRVNGTSFEFAQCQGRLIDLEGVMQKSVDVYNREMRRREGLNHTPI